MVALVQKTLATMKISPAKKLHKINETNERCLTSLMICMMKSKQLHDHKTITPMQMPSTFLRVYQRTAKTTHLSDFDNKRPKNICNKNDQDP